MTRADEERLVRACRKGSRQAFEELLEIYEKPVFNAAYRILNNFEDARDVAQDVLVKAISGIDKFDSRYRFYSWIYRIAINEAINFSRKRRPVVPLEPEHPASDHDPERILGQVEVGRQVQQALMRLTPDQRAVVVLRHFLDCTYHDMAEILEVPEKTVKSRLFAARQALKASLGQERVS